MNRKKEILRNLLDGSFITASKLSENLQVSIRTIRNDINDLNQELACHGAHIETKARYGIRLVVDDFEQYQQYLENSDQEAVNDSNLRYLQIAEYLLELKESISMDDLCDVFFISRSTLKTDMKSVKKLLEKYSIKIDFRANQGLKIKGEEQNIRRCLSYIQRDFIHPYSDISKEDIAKIRKIIETCISLYHFEISDYSITNLAFHIYISIMRIRYGKLIHISSNMKEKLNSSPDQDLILAIVDRIEKAFNVQFSKDEVLYLLIQVSGKKIIGKALDDTSRNTIITNEVYQLVNDMLSSVYHVFKIDFRYDLELITALSLHLVPLEFRMKYDITVQNNMAEEMKQHVILSFNMASVACKFLEKKYGKSLPDDEITFIALHFYVALERKRSKQKENLLVVCGSGKATSELLVYQIKKNLGDIFNVLEATTCYALKDYDFSQVDYILTTVTIDICVPVPIIMTDNFLEYSEVKRIQKAVYDDHLNRVLHYFEKDMVFWSDLDDKESILKFLCAKAVEYKKVPKNFYEYVLKREEIGRTSFGNFISIAHPIQPLGDESFVSMAILKKPILWDDQKVQIVFLLSMKEKGDRGLQDFYKIMSKLVTHRSSALMLSKACSYDEVISVLRQVAASE